MSEVTKQVFQQCRFHQLGTAHHGDDMNPGFRRRQHGATGNLYR